MNRNTIRKAIRFILENMESELKVVGAKKVGIDHKEGFVINLSDGRQDYAPLEGFVLKSSEGTMYGCKFIVGTMRGKIDERRYIYEFQGTDCKEYVEVKPETIRLVNQIS